MENPSETHSLQAIGANPNQARSDEMARTCKCLSSKIIREIVDNTAPRQVITYTSYIKDNHE